MASVSKLLPLWLPFTPSKQLLLTGEEGIRLLDLTDKTCWKKQTAKKLLLFLVDFQGIWQRFIWPERTSEDNIDCDKIRLTIAERILKKDMLFIVCDVL